MYLLRSTLHPPLLPGLFFIAFCDRFASLASTLYYVFSFLCATTHHIMTYYNMFIPSLEIG